MGCFSSKSIVVELPPPPPRQNTEDFASDTVDIQYDDRKDEVEISVQEKDDPKPGPSGDITVDNHFFADENFQLASDDADIRELDTVQDDTTVNSSDALQDDVDVKLKPPGKQVPKLSFTAIDLHARQAKESHAETFQTLTNYLTEPIGNDYRETKLARAIVVWLSQQNVDNKIYGDASTTTPRGLLQHLKLKTMTYATCYVILCRSAGLTCTLIKGIVKAAGYEPGDTEAPSSPWTAVLADGAWRIVHPFWICRALYGHSLAGWVKVEQDGKSINQRTRASEGVSRNAFQDNYFMPKPEHFIHECFPNDTRCELLSRDEMIKSTREFFDLPYLLPPFFGLGLELISEEPKCHLHTTGGFCQVQIKAKGSNGHMIVLAYELFAKDSFDFNPKSIQRMVFNSRSNEYFTFDIRFPCTGTFKLVIYGGPYKSPLLRLCEFKITRAEQMSGHDLLPISGGSIGFGPGPITFEAGLFLPSRPNGFITVPKSTRIEINFYVKKEVMRNTEFLAVLVDGKSADRTAFVQYVKTELIRESRRLNITVSLPGEGEFGLQIESTETRTRVVCNYLLSTTEKRTEKANVKLARKKMRDDVKKLEEEKPENWKKQIASCDASIEKCRKQPGLDPLDEDLCMGETLTELYRYKNALRDGKNRRNIRVLTAVLNLAKRYKNEMVIAEEVEKAENFMKRLLSLTELSKEASRLGDAFSYLDSYDAKYPDVESVYRTVLLLLRYSATEIKTMDQIQSKLLNAEGAVKRLTEIHKAEIIQVHRTHARREFDKVDGESIRINHGHVYGLYKWVQKVLDVYDGQAEDSLQNSSEDSMERENDA